MITSGDGDIPLYLRVGNGNEADQAIFTEVIAEFQQQWKAAQPEVYVADAALYNEENLAALGETPWISRVPGSIGEAEQLMQTLPSEMFLPSCSDNYTMVEVCSTYHLQGTLALNEEAVTLQRNQAGRFILATNLLDEQLWPNETILQEYKNQQSCERGFRFLKDPLFFASRMIVKLPQRVAALAMIMGLCLLVYSIGQRQLRQALAQTNETIPNQRGKPTERPTLRAVIQ